MISIMIIVIEGELLVRGDMLLISQLIRVLLLLLLLLILLIIITMIEVVVVVVVAVLLLLLIIIDIISTILMITAIYQDDSFAHDLRHAGDGLPGLALSVAFVCVYAYRYVMYL